jgi:hypothetical protein
MPARGRTKVRAARQAILLLLLTVAAIDSVGIDIADVLVMKPVFGIVSPRHDIDQSGGPINIADVLGLKPFFGGGCLRGAS